MKILTLLSGSGVFDGAEIHESVLTLLALKIQGLDYAIAAPDMLQASVINHLTGEETGEKRNVLTEAARIARGEIIPARKVDVNDYDGLAMPGGFGVAKNFTKWAMEGPKGEIQKDVKRIILDFWSRKKPILALCMSPVVVAKALEEKNAGLVLTIGSGKGPSSYEIAQIQEGLRSISARPEDAYSYQIIVDEKNRVITSPCYMMTTEIHVIYAGITAGVEQMKKWLNRADDK